MKRSWLYALSALLGAVLTSSPSFAQTTQWTLEGVSNGSGATITGSFDYNPSLGSLGTYSNVLLQDNWGPGQSAPAMGSRVYDDTVVATNLSDEFNLWIATTPTTGSILGTFYFSLLLDFGTKGSTDLSDIQKLPVSGNEQYLQLFSDGYHQIDSTNWTGYVVPTETCTAFGCFAITPLPAAMPLFASGAGILGLLGWRRRRARFA
jgi:hypothetical protein